MIFCTNKKIISFYINIYVLICEKTMPMQKIRLKWRGPFDPYDDYPDEYFYMMYDKRKYS